MRAVYIESFAPESPLDGLVVGERPEPVVPPGWSLVEVRAASLNRHDLWSLRGVGLAEKNLPMILGCDAAGVTEDGREVIVHAVVADRGRRSVLSEQHQGAFAERLVVPTANLVTKPAELTFEEAACLPTAWLTAYQMLFGKADVEPGGTVLVQGAGGGLATALVLLARSAGFRVLVTSRSEQNRAFALDLGAEGAYESGARLPERVDAVMDSVGAATWPHSLKCLKPGGTMVVSGATSGYQITVDAALVFAKQLTIRGSSMGSLERLDRLANLCASAGIKPPIHQVLPLAEAHAGFAAMEQDDLRGKIVFTP
ncbi:quinone oxidoreductase family protein [Pseudonocardia xishanensis]|uniref:Zinc-binding dehydrogenase n=1 Tax=Pseudonocardia xishanensis TaxID=630995 RepID=A0ABP8RUN8_9PSEU